MTDLISRQDAIAALNEDIKFLEEEEKVYGVSTVEMRNRTLEWLNNLPTILEAEVKDATDTI